MQDMNIRQVPEEILTIKDGVGVMTPVNGAIAYPPNLHPQGCPIVETLTALELQTCNGSRWFGFEKAWIHSTLNMVVQGFGSRDEVRSTWKIVDAD